MGNKLYDVLKFLALIAFPAMGTLYFTLAGIWSLPGAEQVVGTIVAVDTFLGVVLQISATQFNAATAKGTILAFDNADKSGKSYSLEFEKHPEEELEGKQRAVFEIKHTQ